MAAWDDEDSDSGSPPPAIVKKTKFGDEEEEADVADSWDAEDSEAEREKEKKKAEADAKKAAEAAANKKSRTQRVAEHQTTNAARKAQLEAELAALEDEDSIEAKERARLAEIEADLANAGDLLGAMGVSSQTSTRKSAADRSIIQTKTESGEEVSFDLASLPLFQPKLKTDFDEIKAKMVPLFAGMQKKGHYPLFLQEFFREVAKGLSSEQIKKLGSIFTTLTNEKLREEKAADNKGKKTSKAKAKATVTLGGAGAGKGVVADTTNYENEADDYDDFM